MSNNLVHFGISGDHVSADADEYWVAKRAVVADDGDRLRRVRGEAAPSFNVASEARGRFAELEAQLPLDRYSLDVGSLLQSVLREGRDGHTAEDQQTLGRYAPMFKRLQHTSSCVDHGLGAASPGSGGLLDTWRALSYHMGTTDVARELQKYWFQGHFRRKAVGPNALPFETVLREHIHGLHKRSADPALQDDSWSAFEVLLQAEEQAAFRDFARQANKQSLAQLAVCASMCRYGPLPNHKRWAQIVSLGRLPPPGGFYCAVPRPLRTDTIQWKNFLKHRKVLDPSGRAGQVRVKDPVPKEKQSFDWTLSDGSSVFVPLASRRQGLGRIEAPTLTAVLNK